MFVGNIQIYIRIVERSKKHDILSFAYYFWIIVMNHDNEVEMIPMKQSNPKMMVSKQIVFVKCGLVWMGNWKIWKMDGWYEKASRLSSIRRKKNRLDFKDSRLSSSMFGSKYTWFEYNCIIFVRVSVNHLVHVVILRV